MQGKMDKYNGNRAVMELTGQIGKISDLKYTKAGTAFVEFSIYALINKQRYWYNNLVAYEQNAQELKNYADKNTKTTVFAFPEEISWKDKETGASLAQVKTESSVYCTFGLGNLRKLGDFIKANNFEEVILAVDNDGDSINTKNLIDAAIKELNEQSVNINVILPSST